MPRFFFDTRSDHFSFRDMEGTELASSEMAGEELIRAIPGMLRDELPRVAESCRIRADVRDDAGQVIFTAQLSLTTEWLDLKSEIPPA